MMPTSDIGTRVGILNSQWISVYCIQIQTGIPLSYVCTHTSCPFLYFIEECRSHFSFEFLILLFWYFFLYKTRHAGGYPGLAYSIFVGQCPVLLYVPLKPEAFEEYKNPIFHTFLFWGHFEFVLLLDRFLHFLSDITE